MLRYDERMKFFVAAALVLLVATPVRGLSAERETPASTGRVGVAGWTAPNTPVGSPLSGWSEINGWFAIGLSVTWDGPPPVRSVRPPAR